MDWTIRYIEIPVMRPHISYYFLLSIFIILINNSGFLRVSALLRRQTNDFVRVVVLASSSYLRFALLNYLPQIVVDHGKLIAVATSVVDDGVQPAGEY